MSDTIESQNKIKFLTFADYVTPAKTENAKAGWVEYGDDNLFFEYIIELYNNSATNSACIRGTSNLIYGQGLDAVAADKNLEAYINLKTVFRSEDVRNVCNDFKAFGMAAFECIFNKNRDKITRALHLPMNYLRSGIANDEGNVTEWHYATDWTKSKENDFKTTSMPVLGYHAKSDERAVLIIKPYTFGTFYYSTPDYIGAMKWADIESEVSNYHLSNLQNGMWPGMLINFNNGVPPEDEQIAIEKSIHGKWGKGSNAAKFILAFNRDKESAATIEPVQLSDAAEQFQAVASEASEKILLGHRITSPMLLGIKNNTGLGNNADELKDGHALFLNTVVKPMQEPILTAIDTVLSFNKYALDLYFKPLTPLEFKDYSMPMDQATREKETGLTMSSQEIELADDVAEDWIAHLHERGETIDPNEWELEYEEEVIDYEKEAVRTKMFARFADPEAKSPQGDSGLYKVRYRYSQNLKENTREFCRKMVANSKNGVVYRLEDIDEMTEAKMNIELSPADCKRCGYNIFAHKGGARCHHRWVRQVYFRKRDAGKFMPKSQTSEMENDKRVPITKAEKQGVPEKVLKPKGWTDAETRPIDTPTKGFKDPKYAR